MASLSVAASQNNGPFHGGAALERPVCGLLSPMGDREAGNRALGGDRQVEQWLHFALHQEARMAPHPHGRPRGDAATGPAAGCRLTFSHLESLPLFQGRDRPFDVRLGVTLFDDDAGCFFGPTARSAAVPYDMRRSKGKRGFHVDLESAFFLSTRTPLAASTGACTTSGAGVADALPVSGSGNGVLAVVEVALVERGEGGLVSAEYSAAWCAIPLGAQPGIGIGGLTPAVPGMGGAAAAGVAAATPLAGRRGRGIHGYSPAPGSPCSPLRAGVMAARLGAHALLRVPLFVGSPRFLLLQRTLPAAQCPPPPQLLADGAECRLHYQFEPCPDMVSTWGPLVPEDFLVSSRDLVPGVQRQPVAGSRSCGVLEGASQLAPPRLHSVQAVVLAGLSVRLPEGFVEAVRRHGSGSAGRLLSVGDVQEGLRLRVSVHNGRRFVGPPAECQAAALDPIAGYRGEHLLVLGQDAPLAWLPADRRVVLVLELVLASDGGSGCGAAGMGSELVLGWAAVAPFRWHGQGGSSCTAVAALAEGSHQAALRSGPGRWLRPAPVLDWRCLLERANRSSPPAPSVSFTLLPAPGQAVWPPPAAPVPLQAVAPAPAAVGPRAAARTAAASPVAPARGAQRALQAQAALGSSREEQRSTAASEAETLLSLQASPRGSRASWAPVQGARKAAASTSSKRIEPQLTLQAWQIHAHHDEVSGGLDGGQTAAAARAAAEAAAEEPALWWQSPMLPSILTRPGQGEAAVPAPGAGTPEDAAALYAGSPTKQARQGARVSAADAAVAAAVAAMPAEAASELCVSLQAELSDELVTAAASIQLLGFEQLQGRPEGQPAPQLPQRLHFTFRFFHSGDPTITPPLHLAVLGGATGAGGLYALAAGAAGGCAGADPEACPPAPELPLQLLDVAELEQRAAELAAQGAPPAAASRLARQLRLRAARHLAERRLHVDVWDSDSLLQVGTLSVPLRALLRQGLPAAEAVLTVRVADPMQGIARLEDSSEPAQLCTAPLRGCFLLRLACRGTPLPHSLGGGSAGNGAWWPASPTKHSLQPVMLQHGARQSEEGRQQHGPPGAVGEEGRRDAILWRLQAELPSCTALCAAPGEAVGFECEFVNSSSEEGWFSLSLAAGERRSDDGGSGSAGREDAAAGVSLCLVTDGKEWEVLAVQAREAGLASERRQQPGGSGPRVVGSARFHLEPRERCLLRFKLSRSLQAGLLDEPEEQGQLAPSTSRAGAGGSGGKLSRHDIRVLRSSPGTASSMAQDEPAAAFRVAVLALKAPVVDRTLRLYCPAGAGSTAAAVHAVQLPELPGSSRLLAAARALAFASSSPHAAAVLRQSCALLTCAAPAAGATARFLLTASCGASVGAGMAASGSCVETWEVFLHGVPAVWLAANVGATATAQRLLPELATASAGDLCCHWRGVGAGELQASVGEATAAPGMHSGGGSSGGRLALAYEPAYIHRQALLLSVTVSDRRPGGSPVRRQQAELLLVSLDSTSTAVSRSFEVAVPAGQAVSKKVRYTSPYPEARRFSVRLPGSGRGGSAGRQLLRIGRPVFELGCREAAAIRLTFDAAAAAVASTEGRRQRHELLAVLESAPLAGGESCVEEVFRILVTLT